MGPKTLLDLQISLFRQMTGEQRLSIALQMHEDWCEDERKEIRAAFPDFDKQAVERELRQRIALARRP